MFQKEKQEKQFFWQVVSNDKSKVEKEQISKSKSSNFQSKNKQKDTSFHRPINYVDKIPSVRKYDNN